MKITTILETRNPEPIIDLSKDTTKSYRKLAIVEAMKKHHAGGACNENEACKRAKNVARSIHLDLKRRGQIREAVMNMPLDAAAARLADLRDFIASVPRTLHSQEQYDAVDDARDEIRELEAYLAGGSVQESATTAGGAYTARAEQCKELLGKISQYLEVHAQKQQDNTDSWGFAGDLAHVCGQLEEIWEFLTSDDVTESEQLDELANTTMQSRVVNRANGDAFSMDAGIGRESHNNWVSSEKKAERKVLRGIQGATTRRAGPSYGDGGRRYEENEEMSEFSPRFIQGVACGEIDLYDAIQQDTPDARALQRMYDITAAEIKAAPDDDHEDIFDVIQDKFMYKFSSM